MAGEIGNFFNNLGSSLTGQNKVELSQQALQIQEQVAKDTLAAEIQAQQLKYNPTLSRERSIQIALVVIPLTIVIGLIVYFKYFR